MNKRRVVFSVWFGLFLLAATSFFVLVVTAPSVYKEPVCCDQSSSRSFGFPFSLASSDYFGFTGRTSTNINFLGLLADIAVYMGISFLIFPLLPKAGPNKRS